MAILCFKVASHHKERGGQEGFVHERISEIWTQSKGARLVSCTRQQALDRAGHTRLPLLTSLANTSGETSEALSFSEIKFSSAHAGPLHSTMVPSGSGQGGIHGLVPVTGGAVGRWHREAAEQW